MTRASPPPVFWIPERVEVLTDLWKRGFSCSQIAKRIGGCSRNAVIGKIHRMSLQSRSAEVVEAALALGGRMKAYGSRDGSPRPKRPTRPKVQVHARAPRLSPYVPPTPTPVDASFARAWTSRRFGECAAPISGEGADTLSCCTPCGDHTYCKAHRAVLFVKPKDSADRLVKWGVRFAA